MSNRIWIRFVFILQIATGDHQDGIDSYLLLNDDINAASAGKPADFWRSVFCFCRLDQHLSPWTTSRQCLRGTGGPDRSETRHHSTVSNKQKCIFMCVAVVNSIAYVRYLKDYESVVEEKADSEEDFIERVAGNPIHAYRLMKRLYFDWQTVEKEIKTDEWRSRFATYIYWMWLNFIIRIICQTR